MKPLFCPCCGSTSVYRTLVMNQILCSICSFTWSETQAPTQAASKEPSQFDDAILTWLNVVEVRQFYGLDGTLTAQDENAMFDVAQKKYLRLIAGEV